MAKNRQLKCQILEMSYSRGIKETQAYLQQLSWVAYWSMLWDAAVMSLHKNQTIVTLDPHQFGM